MMAPRGLSFGELFSLHGVLDEERRPLGEHRAPSSLVGSAPTELRPCPYPGSRHENALPMNLSALRQTTRHWDETLAGLIALRSWCGGGSQPLTLTGLWRLTAAAAVLPAYLLYRADASPVLDAGTAVLYKACLGLKFLIEQRALEELLATGTIDDRGAADSLAGYAETSGWLVGRQEVCAATAGMIADVLAAAIRGGDHPAGSRLAAAVESPAPFQAFARASWNLYGLLLAYSTWSARRCTDPAPAADPPAQNRFSLTLGMRRLSAAASALDEPRCAAVLEALCSIATPPGDDDELAAARARLAGEHDPERAESFAAQKVRGIEHQLNAALGREIAPDHEPWPDLSAYRARPRSA